MFSIGAPAAGQTLQERIDAASPGDTLWLEAGDYPRRVTADAPITLAAVQPGTARLAGITAAQVHLVDLVFDGNLDQAVAARVVAGPGLVLRRCRFVNSIRGVEIPPGADAQLSACRLEGLIEGIRLDPGAAGLVLTDPEFADCALGIALTDTLSAQGERQAAARCQGLECAPVTITGGIFSGTGRHLELTGNLDVSITGTRFTGGETAVSLRGARLTADGVELLGTGSSGQGLQLVSVSGSVINSLILTWDTGITVGDGGTPFYSDLVLGGELFEANDIGNGTWDLVVEQPEPIPVEPNFWGSLDCQEVNAKVSGQWIDRITDSFHSAEVVCTPTAVTPATWGSLKTRWRAGAGP